MIKNILQPWTGVSGNSFYSPKTFFFPSEEVCVIGTQQFRPHTQRLATIKVKESSNNWSEVMPDLKFWCLLSSLFFALCSPYDLPAARLSEALSVAATVQLRRYCTRLQGCRKPGCLQRSWKNPRYPLYCSLLETFSRASLWPIYWISLEFHIHIENLQHWISSIAYCGALLPTSQVYIPYIFILLQLIFLCCVLIATY